MKIRILNTLFSISLIFSPACIDDDWLPDNPPKPLNARNEMSKLVQEISAYSRQLQVNFIVIPQNGIGLLTIDGDSNGLPATQYLNGIDAVATENLFYGAININVPTSTSESAKVLPLLNRALAEGKPVFVTDYCFTPSFIDNSYLQNTNLGYISFASERLQSDNIPSYPATPFQVNPNHVSTIGDVKNYLYLTHPDSYTSKQAYLDSLKSTDYDMLVLDLFWNGVALTQPELASLRVKNNGASRLVLAYLNIAEAEDNRYYWELEWKFDTPSWLLNAKPSKPGSYYVRYWDVVWREILFGNDNSYVKKVIDAGFDGIWLDGADNYEFFPL